MTICEANDAGGSFLLRTSGTRRRVHGQYTVPPRTLSLAQTRDADLSSIVKPRAIRTLKTVGAVLLFVGLCWLEPAVAQGQCNCKGYAGLGGPCYAGLGGSAYDGPGGPAYRGPGGPCYAGPGGPEYGGPGKPANRDPGGPRYGGPGGPAYDGPGSPAYSGANPPNLSHSAAAERALSGPSTALRSALLRSLSL